MARLRFELASHTQWQARPRECRTLAASGLDYLADGQDAATLHLLGAQAAAQLGDADAAGRAIIAAHDARERGHPNELLEIGGEFGLSRAPFIACAADPGLAVTSLLWALAPAGSGYQIAANVAFVSAVPNDHRAQAFGVVSTGVIAGQAAAILAAGILAETPNPAHVVAGFGVAGTLAALTLARSGRTHRPMWGSRRVPGSIVYDRTKTVVRRQVAPGEALPLHPEAVAFAGHYDFTIDVLAA